MSKAELQKMLSELKASFTPNLFERGLPLLLVIVGIAGLVAARRRSDTN